MLQNVGIFLSRGIQTRLISLLGSYFWTHRYRGTSLNFVILTLKCPVKLVDRKLLEDRFYDLIVFRTWLRHTCSWSIGPRRRTKNKKFFFGFKSDKICKPMHKPRALWTWATLSPSSIMTLPSLFHDSSLPSMSFRFLFDDSVPPPRWLSPSIWMTAPKRKCPALLLKWILSWLV